MTTYEQRLNNSLAWALWEGGMHFENESCSANGAQKGRGDGAG
jgi:hypothetical protein